jgi:Fe-S-cluster containining protein
MIEVAVDDGPLPAGDLAAWLHDVRLTRRGGRDAAVPCDGCTACCTSSQFVHIGPDEVETLARIPADLLFPAPRMPRGHVLMGYDDQGRCPMLVDGRCSIYEHRPRTCRTYDCRVFAAAGVTSDDDKILIARRARRWEFSYATEDDRARHAAVRAAATYLRAHADDLPPGAVSTSPTPLALLAIQVHELFLERDGANGAGALRLVEPDPEVVRAEVVRRTAARRAGARRRARAHRRAPAEP